MLADGIRLDFVCGDEVYGSCTELRECLEARGQGYVLRVPSNFHLTVARGVTLTCAQAASRLLAGARRGWETRSAGNGSKGPLVRVGLARHRLCPALPADPPPPASPASWPFTTATCPKASPSRMTRLVRAAGLSWPVEEDFELGKDCFGLDQSQVRLYTAIARHTVLVMAALAICAVTAALLRGRTDTQAPPRVQARPAPAARPGHDPADRPRDRPPAHRSPRPAQPRAGWPGAAATRHAHAGTTSAPGSPETKGSAGQLANGDCQRSVTCLAG